MDPRHVHYASLGGGFHLGIVTVTSLIDSLLLLLQNENNCTLIQSKIKSHLYWGRGGGGVLDALKFC